MPHPSMRITRRSALLGLATACTLGRSSLALAAAPTDRRLVVVLLRGALDGMAAVVPYGDPDLATLRPGLIGAGPGQPGGVLDLGGFFGLHPALAGLHGMYADNEMLAVHAVAGPYRTRSHFDAQDCMESGAEHRLASGWLNRAVAAMPGRPAGALALGVQVPLLLRGSANVGTYAPTASPAPAPELLARIADLMHGDPLLGPAVTEGLHDRGFSAAALAGMDQPAAGGPGAFAALAGAAGRLMAAADGPRVAAMEAGGWDTHAGQARRLEAPLRALDAGLVALRDGLGAAAWHQTAVLVMTEFGRTARVNGTGGTDHGTGGVAFVLGGAVTGGRVLADWPGLGAGRLFEDRDLQPTADLRAVAAGLLAGHLGVPAGALGDVFPGGVQPVNGLLRA
jgi:uncharacterized protein (DUF1501 family)